MINALDYNHQVTEFELKSRYHVGGVRGVMVIVIGNGHGDTSSNPGRGWLDFS